LFNRQVIYVYTDKIEDMILDPELNSRYWLVRKVVCLVGYYGGLRSIELRSIEFGHTFESGERSFDHDESGYWFSIERGKQRGLPSVSTFCVPRRQEDWSAPVTGPDRNPVDYDPASVIDRYLELIELDLNSTRDKLTGSFFKSAHGLGARTFRNTPMGKNLLERVGRQFAEELFIPNPESFTSHCWRRTCGTNASNSGVNVTSLMAFMGWKTPKTAIGYVAKSRLSAFNMSMLLCNVQRQNKDLDRIVEA
jgi:integrase